jgi:hypothetical protein
MHHFCAVRVVSDTQQAISFSRISYLFYGSNTYFIATVFAVFAKM